MLASSKLQVSHFPPSFRVPLQPPRLTLLSRCLEIENDRLRHIRLHERVNDLPDANYATLKFLMAHLDKYVPFILPACPKSVLIPSVFPSGSDLANKSTKCPAPTSLSSSAQIYSAHLLMGRTTERERLWRIWRGSVNVSKRSW